jgi:hypothetical protein
MPSMAPLSGGNKDGDGPGKGRGIPFGGRFGLPDESPSRGEAAGKRKAATGLSETRVSKYELCV